MKPIRIPRLPAILVAGAACAAVAAAPASAGTGGVVDYETGPIEKAKLRKGKAIAPKSAPKRVKRAIRFANRIRRKPYRWGGGHRGGGIARGYDCSGAVSYALHGARMLERPIPSGTLRHWGEKGKGRWITVYAHGGHTYAMIAGLRWDTAGLERGSGPRWHASKRSRRGYKVRHLEGF